MSGLGYLPKGPRGTRNGQHRAPKLGSQTWSPGQTIYNQHGHVAQLPPHACAVFYGHQMKQDYVNFPGTNGGFDSSPSSEGSMQGSPRSQSINSYDLSEDLLSTVSSPSEEYHAGTSYFADVGIPTDAGALHLGGPLFPLNSVQPTELRALPQHYTVMNRPRQGSAGLPSPQPIIDQHPHQRIIKNEDPTSPVQRRGQKQTRNQRRGGPQKGEYYIIPVPAENVSDDGLDDGDETDEPAMLTTLNARAQFAICKEVDEVLRSCLFWWLVTYKFDIPRNPRARDIETAEDRDYEGFCSIVNDLTAKRWVPREAVHHERIAELNTVLAGPSEIRHMLAHPERHLKSDWRMLGLIAAAIEVCKILQYKKGHKRLYQLYLKTEARIASVKAAKLDGDTSSSASSGDDRSSSRSSVSK